MIQLQLKEIHTWFLKQLLSYCSSKLFFLQAEGTPNPHYFSIYYFFPFFSLSIREHCHFTCLVRAWIKNDMWEAFARVKSLHSCWKNPKWTFYPGQISVLFTIYTLGCSSCKWRYRSCCPKWTKTLRILSSFGGLFVLLFSHSILHSTAAPMPSCCEFK